MRKKILLFLLLNSWFFIAQKQPTVTLSKKAQVSIINCDVGNQSYSLYGHTAIRIKDTSQNIDVVFNYGTFNFETPNFMLKFIKGDLQYFVSARSFQQFIYTYQYENRTVYEQILLLSQEQKQYIFNNLYNIIHSPNRYYTYKFIDKNCTTMAIDKVNETLNSKLIKNKPTITKTYRELLYPYLENHFFEKLGINIIFGTKVDEKATKLFLPLNLIEVITNTKHNKKPLALPITTLYKAKNHNYQPSIFNSIYTLIAGLLLIVFSKRKWLTLSYFFTLGILGLFFCCIGFYSYHQEVLYNYNILLFNPLYLILLFFIYKKKYHFIKITAQIIITLLLVYIVYMLNIIHLKIVSPIIIANFILVKRLLTPRK